ncbi:MAG: ABC transporter substrate-binding protein [Gammaproteobacteria bacterium]|nr:MAG: ABC transporter substrate-binding protein [Gammaproteobacteria bacterium]
MKVRSKTMVKNILMSKSIFMAFVMLFSTAVFADEMAPKQTAMPNELVRTTVDSLFDAIKKERAENEGKDLPSSRVKELVEELVIPSVDFVVMSRWVVGKYWRKMSKEQKKEFTLLFRDLLIKTYAGSLPEFVDYKVNYFPYKHDAKSKKVSIRMEIERTDGPKVPIAFKLRKNKKSLWKVYDILVDGISLIANYRTTFSSIAKKKGVSGLIDKLKTGEAEKDAKPVDIEKKEK